MTIYRLQFINFSEGCEFKTKNRIAMEQNVKWLKLNKRAKVKIIGCVGAICDVHVNFMSFKASPRLLVD